MNWLKETFGTEKPIIAMFCIHCCATFFIYNLGCSNLKLCLYFPLKFRFSFRVPIFPNLLCFSKSTFLLLSTMGHLQINNYLRNMNFY